MNYYSEMTNNLREIHQHLNPLTRRILMTQPQSKTVLITGASSGIGHATALKLYEEGFTVFAAARRIELMTDLQEKGIHCIHMDITDDNSMKSGVDEIINNYGRLDILVNNAGYGSYGALEDVPLEEARKQFEVNVFGLGRLTQLALPHMRKNNYGKIVNVSSIGGKIGEAMGSWYHATKFAVEGLSDCLRLELADFGIDVILIEPGAINTEWDSIACDKLNKTSGHTAYSELATKSTNMLRKAFSMGTKPEEIAKVIYKSLTVKSPKARYAKGTGAGITLFLRKILSDRLFDKFLTLAGNHLSKPATT
jgi:NAD(P)-dependent dehydrogenase (short-subunit alcohol dehydrogenase family)